MSTKCESGYIFCLRLLLNSQHFGFVPSDVFWPRNMPADLSLVTMPAFTKLSGHKQGQGLMIRRTTLYSESSEHVSGG